MVSAVSAAMAVMVVEAGVAGRDASRHRAPAARCSKFCDCMVKEAEGDDVGEWLYIYYSHATRTLDSLLASYEAAAASGAQAFKEGELA